MNIAGGVASGWGVNVSSFDFFVAAESLADRMSVGLGLAAVFFFSIERHTKRPNAITPMTNPRARYEPFPVSCGSDGICSKQPATVVFTATSCVRCGIIHVRRQCDEKASGVYKNSHQQSTVNRHTA
jgi:hypothetical protein